MKLIAIKEARGELPKGTYHHWESVTPDIISLPDHVEKQAGDEPRGFVSAAQARKIRELEDKGDVKPGTYDNFKTNTKNFDKLPEHASDHPDAHAAFIVAPYKGGIMASTRPIDKRSKAGEFGLVGGKLNPGETALQAAVRESKEEGWIVHKPHFRPIHVKHNPDGKKIVVFAAAGARKLQDYKERDREIHQLTVSRKELGDSHPMNHFIHGLNTDDIKKEIAVGPSIRRMSAAGMDPSKYYHKDLVDKHLEKKADQFQTSQTGNEGADGGFGITPPPPAQDEKLNQAAAQQQQQQITQYHTSVQGKKLPPRPVPAAVRSAWASMK